MPVTNRILTALLFLNLSWFSGVLPAAENASLNSQQRQFLAAHDALLAGKTSEFQRLKKSLRKYNLYPYLEYAELERNITSASDHTIQRFIKQYANTPLADRMRKLWLKELAKQQRWKKYYAEYSDRFSANKTLYCHYLNAALKQRKNVLPDVKKVWLTGKTLPKACVPVFKYLYDSHHMTPDLIWQRFMLAANKRNKKLAKFLAKKLPASERKRYDDWLKMDKQPLESLTRASTQQDDAKLRDLLVYGIKRYSREDTATAWSLWNTRIKPDFKFSDEQINEVERSIALRAAWRHEPEASTWLALLNEAAVNDEAKKWRIRSAIREQDWPNVLRQIGALDEEERSDEQWQYWKARAYQEIGRNVSAKIILETLAKETSYYGFLAADKLGLPYQFNHETVTSDADAPLVKKLAQRPDFKRSRELFKIGWDTDARREWNLAIKSMSKDEKRLAAKLADDWGWHFTAILTVAQARHFDDLELRFPLLYQDVVKREAMRNQIQPSWIYGVIRRESAWREKVRSPAGALGLMQLMPATAKRVSRKLGQKRRLSSSQIMEVPRNISLGSAYLRQVMDKYNDHEILATASYNAGPHRVRRWLPEEGTLPADVWVDTITFDETRNYVKAVMAYSTIADWKLGGKIRRLSERMPTVFTLEQIEAANKEDRLASKM